MTEPLTDVPTSSDAELIGRVRGGDNAAYGKLFERHRPAAERLSRQLVHGPDADDLVSEAFAKVLGMLQRGGGPDVAFRAYLLTAVRRLHVDRVRARSRLHSSGDMTQFDPGIPFQDTAVDGFEHRAAAQAFAALPERWQLVLWHLEVEGQKPAEIAPLLGMSPNSVSALAYRAREGLRQSFLRMHVADLGDGDCRWVNEHLGAHVRHALSHRDSTKMDTHLTECRSCAAVYLELGEVNSGLGAILAPALLGAAATGYLASGSGATVTSGLAFLAGRARDLFLAHSTAATATGVAAGVAAAATTGVLVLRPPAPSPTPPQQPAVVAQQPVEEPVEKLAVARGRSQTEPVSDAAPSSDSTTQASPGRTEVTAAARTTPPAPDVVPAAAPPRPKTTGEPPGAHERPHAPRTHDGHVAPSPGTPPAPEAARPSPAPPAAPGPEFTAAPQGVTAARPNQYAVEAPVSGLSGASALDLFFMRPQERFVTIPESCTLVSPSRMRCTLDPGKDEWVVPFTAQLPGRHTGLLFASTPSSSETSRQIVFAPGR